MRPALRRLAQDGLILIGVVALYGLVYARGFLSGRYLFAGDAYCDLDLSWVMLYSLRAFHALPWWDPTVCNGLPYYWPLLTLHSYLSLFHAPSLLLFRLADAFGGVSIPRFIAFQSTLYPFTLDLAAIYLISRELIEDRIAALLPGFIFAFCYFQVMNSHDPCLEPVTSGLFFVYGVIRYCRRRTGLDLAWLVFFAAAMLGGVSVLFLTSPLFWTVLFSAAVLAYHPDLAADTVRLLRRSLATPPGRVAAALAVLLLASGALVPLTALRFNAGHIARYRGGVVPYGGGDLFSTRPYPIEHSQLWTGLFNWIPFPEVHDRLPLMFAWYGHEYRYIGMATVPLLLAALVLGSASAWTYILALTYFLCNGFLIYTTENLAYRALLDHSELLRNIRNTITQTPREGPLLFLIILAGMGLDRILRRSPEERESAGRAFLGQAFKVLAAAGAALFCSVPWLAKSHVELVHTASHVGFYLAAFSLACWVLLNFPKSRRPLSACLFALVFTDLIISASANYDELRPPATKLWYQPRYRFPADPPPPPPWRYPERIELAPSASEASDLFPGGSFGGLRHHAVYEATREWLVLSTHGWGRALLSNWDAASSMVRRYPAFELYANGRYIPFDALKDEGGDPLLVRPGPAFWLHDKALVESSAAAPRPLPGRVDVRSFSFNEVSLETDAAKDGFLFFQDNYDPFWSASVDGRATTVYRANFTFKAIRLPAGRHAVRWSYDPWPVRGALFAHYALGTIALAALLALELRRLRALGQARLPERRRPASPVGPRHR